MELNGQTAVVTGAGTGMGRAIALALANAGCHVAVLGRRVDKLRETKALAPGRSIHIYSCDVADANQATETVRAIEAQSGRIDILVNNAGVNIRQRRLVELSVNDWEYLLRVNLSGPFHMIRAVLPGMRRERNGLIINISSVAGLRASVLGGAAYSASKHGLQGLCNTLAAEEAANGIRSSLICPGEVNTPILDERPVPVSPERRAAMLQPEDVAAAVLFIASLPPRAHVPELILKPLGQEFV